MEAVAVMRLSVLFGEGEALEAEQHDLFELFERLGFACLNVLCLRKNAFLVVLGSPGEALAAVRRLHGHRVPALRAQLLRREGDDVSQQLITEQRDVPTQPSE